MVWYDPRTWFQPKKDTSQNQPAQTIPQKSTVINLQPTTPSMRVTLPSGTTITPTQIPTQTTKQFTPSQPSGSSNTVTTKPIDASYVSGGSISNPATPELKTLTPQQQTQIQPINTVQPVNRPSGLSGLNYDISNVRNKLTTQMARGQVNPFIYNIEGFGLGLASIGVGTLYTFAHPIQSTKGLYGTITHPLETGAMVGTTLKSEPGFATGVVAGLYLGGKATEYAIKTPVIKGIDIYRTWGLTEETKIIAPEYPSQIYPRISPGERAGDLLKEFTSQGYGYTASPKPLTPELGTLPGTSELPGLYQAPKVSPTFLRVSSEEKTPFSLNPFGTLRPTVSKIKPTSFELTPIVDFSQKNLAPLKSTGEFFGVTYEKGGTTGTIRSSGELIPKAELGKSYVPFIKTEKEAIIPTGTQLEQLPTTTYFKFQGRKIPIEEFKTLIEGTKIKTTFSIEDVSSGYSSIGSKSYITPLNILPISSVTSYKTTSYKIPSYTSTSYQAPLYTTPSYLAPSYTTPNYSVPKISTNYSPPIYKGASYSGVSSGGFSYGGTSYSGGLSSGFIMPPITPPIIPSFDGTMRVRKTKVKYGKQPKKYIPSFGVIAGIQKGKSYSGKRITGLETRGYFKGFTWSFNKPKFKFGKIKI